MSARSVVGHALRNYYHIPEVDGDDLTNAEKVSAQVLTMLLNEHAHELAEKIRSRADERDRVFGKTLECSATERVVANLIDPEVES